MSRCNRKPDITYPCPWSYRVIGADEATLRVAVAEVFGELPYEVSSGNESRTGKYVSIEVSLTVEDEAQRHGLFHSLREHRSVRMVL